MGYKDESNFRGRREVEGRNMIYDGGLGTARPQDRRPQLGGFGPSARVRVSIQACSRDKKGPRPPMVTHFRANLTLEVAQVRVVWAERGSFWRQQDSFDCCAGKRWTMGMHDWLGGRYSRVWSSNQEAAIGRLAPDRQGARSWRRAEGEWSGWWETR
jgi:hypothetical protein